jgi:curved DNA-binding protein CbpA
LAAFDEPSAVPKPVAGFDPAQAEVGALERMVLSNVDGRVSVADIAAASGLDTDDVRTVLARLAELGALEGAAEAPRTQPAPPPPEASAAPTAAGGTSAGGWDRALLDEPGDLDLEVRNMVMDLFHALDELDHYQLLGVARDADRKAIKSAYYGLAARLHTDRYFGKNLGSFKAKMEAVFGRITTAHDTLASKQRRTEYDEYLKDRDRSRAYEKLLQWATVDSASPTPMPRAATAPAQPRILPPPPPSRAVPPPPPPSRAGQIDRAAPPRAVAPSPAPPKVEATPVAAPTPTALTPEQERARRLAAAQRLAGNRVSASRLAATQASAAPRIATPTAEAARAATETLKVRYQDSVDAARRASVKRLVDGADEAAAKEDYVTAANQLRVALTHGEDAELRAKYESVNVRAREILADTYLKQGAYEESQEKWREAGATYAKAAEARPGDADIAAKAANAMRRDGRDLHAAARFGEVAVQKNPASAEFRVTLGLVYFDAGLLLRAKSELEQAVRLAPEDAKAKELLARVKSAIG